MAAITGISIRNFKAVGDKPIELKLAPITLLYGPNGAGKSTILHALQYALEIIERHNLDPDKMMGAQGLDLGGFRNLVHGRDRDRSIVLAFDLDMFEMGFDHMPDMSGLGLSVDPNRLMWPDHIEEGSVELTISWSHLLQRPYIALYNVWLLDRHFASIASGPDLVDTELVFLDEEHPVLNLSDTDDPDPDRGIGSVLFAGKPHRRIGLYGCRGALPPLDEPLHFDFDEHPQSQGEQRLAGVTARGRYVQATRPGPAPDEIVDLKEQAAVGDYLSAMIVGPLQQLREALRDLVHIGPLREVPQRGYRPQSSPDRARWWNGLAAWDRLAEMGVGGADEVDLWLGDKLQSGFGVRVDHLRHVPTDSVLGSILQRGATIDDLEVVASEWKKLPGEARPVLVDQINGLDVQPWDIGVGISQILPIVVAAVDSKAVRLLAVEQPELHVHPRLQTEIGDLFAAAVAPAGSQPSLFEDVPDALVPNGRTTLVETHSEHLVLRLLRRIRERHEETVDPDAPVVAPEMLSVNYMQPSEGGVRLHHLRVDETGEFIDRWPEGFFAERRQELF